MLNAQKQLFELELGSSPDPWHRPAASAPGVPNVFAVQSDGHAARSGMGCTHAEALPAGRGSTGDLWSDWTAARVQSASFAVNVDSGLEFSVNVDGNEEQLPQRSTSLLDL